MDRALIGLVVRGEIHRQYASVSEFLRRTQGVSRRTVERVMRGDATVEYANLARIEGSLDLPRDTLSLVGKHDLDELARIGVDPDLVRWIGSRISKEGTGERAAL